MLAFDSNAPFWFGRDSKASNRFACDMCANRVDSLESETSLWLSGANADLDFGRYNCWGVLQFSTTDSRESISASLRLRIARATKSSTDCPHGEWGRAHRHLLSIFLIRHCAMTFPGNKKKHALCANHAFARCDYPPRIFVVFAVSDAAKGHCLYWR